MEAKEYKPLRRDWQEVLKIYIYIYILIYLRAVYIRTYIHTHKEELDVREYPAAQSLTISTSIPTKISPHIH